MTLVYEARPSDSPYVERMWHCTSEYPGSFMSIAAMHWEMVVTKYQGRTILTVRGPETKATPLPYPEGAEWFGIDFKLGSFMPQFPPTTLVNHQDVHLPLASSRSFWLEGASWEFPTIENADIFVNRLVRAGLVVHDPVVEEMLLHRHFPKDLSPRSIQYRVQRATGLNNKLIYQIGRARRAAALLQQGMSILDTLYDAGYFDQPHLTRFLKRFIGQTPTQIPTTQIVGLTTSASTPILLDAV
jgi:AraC-like DNA-binding protein